ncbi:ATP-binding cassette domain-containing protein (plasmid) [Cupriavidus sp. KK10]|jgi:ABC-type oligopeptide transport system ATPase subunit|uniref:ATP-binding cassette domain-containing protein n=1 Tax=Cupriavidus sp. KK10 TaxID=1478019 RepID=UPI001BA612AD|nr:ATP-binding cassette domain-containing protein [Cupriavidus sp. KK10]
MTKLLEVNGLRKRFPIAGSRSVVQAINGVSLNIQPGETLGLVGESGSGKTTVGRCILGLIEKSDGSIQFDGRDTGSPGLFVRYKREPLGRDSKSNQSA